jgi:quinol monooxygenase YgiN
MITFVAHMKVGLKNAAAYEELMTYVRDKVRAHEPGVAYYDFARRVDDPETFLVIEVYRDLDAHRAHMASPWVRESLPKAVALMEGKPDIRQYVSEGSEPVRQLELG